MCVCACVCVCVCATLVVDEVEKNVHHNECPCAPNAGRAMHHYRANAVVRLPLDGCGMLEVDILKEAQHRPGILRNTVVRPCLEVEECDLAACSVAIVFMVHQELSHDVVGIGGLLQVDHVNLIIHFPLLKVRPIAGALVLNTQTCIKRNNILLTKCERTTANSPDLSPPHWLS